MQNVGWASVCAAAVAALIPVSTASAGNFTVHTLKAAPGVTISTMRHDPTRPGLYAAQDLLDHPETAQSNYTDLYPYLNFKVIQAAPPTGYAYSDRFGSDAYFPHLPNTITANDDPRVVDFVMEATGLIKIPTAGDYTFNINSDDGFRLQIGSNGAQGVDDPRLNNDTLLSYNFPTAGNYSVDLKYYQRGGPAEIEFSAAAGKYTTINSTNASNFHLVGAADGLQLVDAPEPASIALMSIACVGLLKRRRAR
jgi:PA14 domain-containing protein